MIFSHLVNASTNSNVLKRHSVVKVSLTSSEEDYFQPQVR